MSVNRWFWYGVAVLTVTLTVWVGIKQLYPAWQPFDHTPRDLSKMTYSGKVVEVSGREVIVDVGGKQRTFRIGPDTQIQVGAEPGGEHTDIRAGRYVNVLAEGKEALAVHVAK